MNIEEMIAVLEHAKNGGRVEWREANGKDWLNPYPLAWNFRDFDYRPAVEKHYIDGKLVEVGASFWSKTQKGYVSVVSIDRDVIWANCKGVELAWQVSKTTDLRAFKPIMLEETELKVGDVVYVVNRSEDYKVKKIEYNVDGESENNHIYLNGIEGWYEGWYYPTSLTRTAPKKTWWVNRYQDKYVFAFESEAEANQHTTYERHKVEAFTKEEAERIALDMPWPDPKKRLLKRDELPLKFYVMYPNDTIIEVSDYNYDMEIANDRNYLWYPVTDKPLKDIVWRSFEVEDGK